MYVCISETKEGVKGKQLFFSAWSFWFDIKPSGVWSYSIYIHICTIYIVQYSVQIYRIYREKEKKFNVPLCKGKFISTPSFYVYIYSCIMYIIVNNVSFIIYNSIPDLIHKATLKKRITCVDYLLFNT